ncbi:Lar family restriction alleviation protein [Citrobacter sp. FDAARGOS_156]|uniref:Lar family restriction alleviation protein n=1 Tax=Citrobacter sp. FDAARGOS_156 TaxID=1702170 RepID=UPI0019025BDD|nr:Lar family restriction alleviation protein [Citrobacter sp. FDAARGOS_156]MBJ9110076.1 Lar family restriction alleviation protein [Citrobacter sp. FDAARGOS_156]
MTTNNHPANGPVSLERLHQIREILSKAAEQSDGGNLGYTMADAVKVIDVAIAAHNEEPVAYMTYKGYLLHAGDPKVSEYSEPTPLYTATPAPVVLYSANGLMPCPFCGGKAHQLTIEQDNDPHFGGDVITCTECGASSHVEFGFKENLKSAWNSRATMLQAGNSPVSPDGWIPVRERMPDETQPVIVVSDGGVVQRTVYQFCEGVWIDWYEQYDEVAPDAFTHWMPLPAAPKLEVKS